MKAQLMATTGLNAAFATLLLKETGGVYDAAVTLFNQNKVRACLRARAGLRWKKCNEDRAPHCRGGYSSDDITKVGVGGGGGGLLSQEAVMTE